MLLKLLHESWSKLGPWLFNCSNSPWGLSWEVADDMVLVMETAIWKQSLPLGLWCLVTLTYADLYILLPRTDKSVEEVLFKYPILCKWCKHESWKSLAAAFELLMKLGKSKRFTAGGVRSILKQNINQYLMKSLAFRKIYNSKAMCNGKIYFWPFQWWSRLVYGKNPSKMQSISFRKSSKWSTSAEYIKWNYRQTDR